MNENTSSPPPSTSFSAPFPATIEPSTAGDQSLSQLQSLPSITPINTRPKKMRKISFPTTPRPLSADGEVEAAIRYLREADPALIPIIDAHEPPSCKSFHRPFHSLTRSILYQQLAYKAAASIYSRFVALCGGESFVVPEVILGLGQNQLRQIGVSERKGSYLYDLARKYESGILSDSKIVTMDDKSLFTMLTMVKGIGAWSVHMFMIFSLHRPDVLPVGDLGVRKGVQLLFMLDHLPKPSQMEKLCVKWRPYRSIGAWYMWRLIETKGSPLIAATATTAAASTDDLQQQLMIYPSLTQQQQQQSNQGLSSDLG
ncbi:putative DNA-3-methyladenine glycosylase [Zostera marina]|uniref:Putative DNA-3-methyladenine glycosylase n=1 Tax=Zostera marina TaxID=29655 RepID=A0A0K9NX40_ZOSMR|nr:putative DNA-3-methyladenine glycosylase [Zostera marina]